MRKFAACLMLAVRPHVPALTIILWTLASAFSFMSIWLALIARNGLRRAHPGELERLARTNPLLYLTGLGWFLYVVLGEYLGRVTDTGVLSWLQINRVVYGVVLILMALGAIPVLIHKV